MQTSLSDKPTYRDVCRLAATNDEFFTTFKINQNYNEIVEHVSYELGFEYLKLIPEDFNFDIGKLNDRFGGPRTFDYPNIGQISPTSLRYLKVAFDINRLLHLSKYSIVAEIGPAYGAQALILKGLYGWQSYSFYDLEEPLALTEKYLRLNGIDVDNLCDFNDTNKFDSFLGEEFDLVISNYAFSELTRQRQDAYLEKVISSSKQGYMIMNFVSRESGIYSYSLDELLYKLRAKYPKVIPEQPLSSENNCIILWNNV